MAISSSHQGQAMWARQKRNPSTYRRQALTNMLMAGYDVTRNLIFGSDCNVHDYNVEQAKEWITRDQAIFHDLGIAEDVTANIFSEDLKRFLGIPLKRTL